MTQGIEDAKLWQKLILDQLKRPITMTSGHMVFGGIGYLLLFRCLSPRVPATLFSSPIRPTSWDR
ncbi:MAG: hypothetical protein O7F74_12460 [Bacteroidetes bacterium]|nr:hypothetical protein [Bacteroidota bacterium]